MSRFYIVHGNPVAKQRPRTGRNGQVYTPKKTKAYEKMVGYAYKGEKFNKDVDIKLTVYAYRKTKHRIDLSNIIKVVEDGLNNVAYSDDSQIKEIEAYLRYDKENPRCKFKVECR